MVKLYANLVNRAIVISYVAFVELLYVLLKDLWDDIVVASLVQPCEYVKYEVS